MMPPLPKKPIVEPDDPDPLAPAEGIGRGMLLGIACWLIIAIIIIAIIK